jgi:hypothetical protein
VEVSGPNLVWYGDLEVMPLQKSGQTVAWAYFIGLHFVVCHGPVDALVQIRANDKKAWLESPPAVTMDETIQIAKGDLFGGPEMEGGLGQLVWLHDPAIYIPYGQVNVWSGSPSQVADGYLSSNISGGIPAYRGVCSIVFRHFYIGTSTYIKAFKFAVRRLPRGLASGKEDIAGDANPAEMLYELLTDARWGMGADPAVIDEVSFLAAATTLYDEGLGLSMQWDNRRTIEDMAAEILRHIDGLIYTDIHTGKLTLALARKDYAVGDLPVFSASNAKLEDYSRMAWDETTNEVRVVYCDRNARYQDRTAMAQDIANWETQGVLVSTEIQYPGISNAANASKLAARDLKALTFPLAKGTLKINREGSDIAPGAAFVLNWEPLGIVQMVVRALKVSYGELKDGWITVSFSQDVYAMSDSIYADPGEPGWEDPGSDGEDPALVELVEMPYFVQNARTGVDPARALPMILAARPTQDSPVYDLFAGQSGQPYVQHGDGYWTPVGLLDEALGQEDSSTIVVYADSGMEWLTTPDRQERGWSLFQIGVELAAYGGVTDNEDGTYTLTGVWRGLLDTTPAAHGANERVWFLSAGCGSPGVAYDDGDTLNIKCRTRASLSLLALESATAHSITLEGRSLRPYPPGHVMANGQGYPTEITGELAVSWAHRDRLLQEDLVQQTASSVGPESGTTYTLRIYGETDALIHTEAGLSGTSYTYPEATEIADSGLGRLNAHLRFELESACDGRVSWQAQKREFDRSL